jgi:hypothetical protein
MDTIHIPGRNGIQLRENAETASGNKTPKRVYVDNETVDIASKNGSFILKNGFMLVKGRRPGDNFGYIQPKYLLEMGQAVREAEQEAQQEAQQEMERDEADAGAAAAAYVPSLVPGGMPVVQMFFRDEHGRRFTYGDDGMRIYTEGGTRRRKYKGKGRGGKGKSKTARKSRSRKNRNRRSKSKSRN